MDSRTVLCIAVIFLCVGVGSYLLFRPAVGGGPVGRASGSRPAAVVLPDPSCCLIPANKGLHR